MLLKILFCEKKPDQMSDHLFYLIVAGTIVLFADGIIRRGAYLEYPLLVAALYAIWLLPKIIALRSDPHSDLTLAGC